VPDNVELTMRLHSVSGEDVSVITRDFGGAAVALDAIGHNLNERRSLILTERGPIARHASTAWSST
jgi:hypothetical protein